MDFIYLLVTVLPFENFYCVHVFLTTNVFCHYVDHSHVASGILPDVLSILLLVLIFPSEDAKWRSRSTCGKCSKELTSTSA